MEFLKPQQNKLKVIFRHVFANGVVVLTQKNMRLIYQPFNPFVKKWYQTTAMTERFNQRLMNISIHNSNKVSVVSHVQKNHKTPSQVEQKAHHNYSVMLIDSQSDMMKSLTTETYNVVMDYEKITIPLESEVLCNVDDNQVKETIVIVKSNQANYKTQAVSVLGDIFEVNNIIKIEEFAIDDIHSEVVTDAVIETANEVSIGASAEIVEDITSNIDNTSEMKEENIIDTTIQLVKEVNTDNITQVSEIITTDIDNTSEVVVTDTIVKPIEETIVMVEHSIEKDEHILQAVGQAVALNEIDTNVVQEVGTAINQNNTQKITKINRTNRKKRVVAQKNIKMIVERNDGQEIKEAIAMSKKKIRKSLEKSRKLSRKFIEREQAQPKENMLIIDNIPVLEQQISSQQYISTIEHKTNPLNTCYKVGGILLAFAVLNIWVMQRSVNAYYLQTYHQPSPLVKLDDFALWSAGAKIGDFLYAQHDALTSGIQQANQKVVDNFNQNHAFTAEYLAEQEQKRQAQLAQLKLEQEKQAKEQLAQRYVLTPNDKIFFAGDSMMQGVAPHVQQYLQKHNIQSINLSKQSTGLSYPSFFDWPKTIEQTLQQNPDIKILAIFLGPNDPWNIVHPQTKQLLKFASSEWQAEYQSRMLRILNAAKQHQVSVIWLTSPNMKDDKLNRQMVDLNKIINDELSKHDDVLAIDTRALLGSQNDVYNDYLVKDGQSIKMRTGDGVHFTPQGQKNVAQALQQHLTIMP